MTLQGRTILVVEDLAVFAHDLSAAVEEAGGRVLGPTASVGSARRLIRDEPVDGAILDVQLPDGEITPLAELLLAQGVPVVIQSGYPAPARFAVDHPKLSWFAKPVMSDHVIAHLAAQLAPAAA